LFTFVHNCFVACNQVSFQHKGTVVDLVQQIFEDIFFPYSFMLITKCSHSTLPYFAYVTIPNRTGRRW